MLRPVPRQIIAVLFAFASLAVWCEGAEGPGEIKPPFGTYWGLPLDRLTKTLEETRANIVEKKVVSGRTALVVEGLVHPNLQRAVFYFREDGLDEVELHYGAKNWDARLYSDYFDRMRRTLERKYGIGKLITRSKKREGAVIMTLIGYGWHQAGCTLQAFYFSADQDSESFRVVSLHYRSA